MQRGHTECMNGNGQKKGTEYMLKTEESPQEFHFVEEGTIWEQPSRIEESKTETS